MAPTKSRGPVILLDARGLDLSAALNLVESLRSHTFLLPRVPLHWILDSRLPLARPAQNPQEGRIQDYFRERLQQEGDCLLFPPFSGLPQSALFAEEILRDWNLAGCALEHPGNHQGTGSPFLHLDPELSPRELLSLSHAYPGWLLVLPRKNSRNPRCLVIHRGKSRLLRGKVLEKPSQVEAICQRFLPGRPGPGTSRDLYFLPLAHPDILQLLEPLGHFFASPGDSFWGTLDQSALSTGLPRSSQLADFLRPPLSPEEKAPQQILAESRQTATFHGRPLFTVPPENRKNPAIIVPPSIHRPGGMINRVLEASMQGSTEIREGQYWMEFVSGRPHCLKSLPEGRILSGAFQSYLESRGTRWVFRSKGAFSLEGGESWGVREFLHLEGPGIREPGLLSAEYFFSSAFSGLGLSFSIRYPRWNREFPIERWAPMELPLFPGIPRRKILWKPLDSAESHSWNPLPAKGVRVRGRGICLQSPLGQLRVLSPDSAWSRPQEYLLEPVGLWEGLGCHLVLEGGRAEHLGSHSFEGWEEHLNFILQFNESQESPVLDSEAFHHPYVLRVPRPKDS